MKGFDHIPYGFIPGYLCMQSSMSAYIGSKIHRLPKAAIGTIGVKKEEGIVYKDWDYR